MSPVRLIKTESVLHRVLAQCGIDPQKISQIVERLSNPPLSFHISSWDCDPPETASQILNVVGFDRDQAARMLRLDEGKPDPEITWAKLSRSERKRAEHRWKWALEPDELGVAPQGVPPKIDSALVLWCSRVLADGIGQPHLAFSRPVWLDAKDRERSGPPTGPEWRALLAALKVAQVSIDRMVQGYAGAAVQIDDPRHAESIAQIVKLDRKTEDRRAEMFAKTCHSFGLGSTADDVANHPQEFRYVMARARRHRTRKPSRPHHSKRVP
jgi:hypothetical protein